MPRGALYLVFIASGFAGLIYESIWTHYLKLFLGHAAYAQSLVLAVFMGAMAAGAWLCGRFSGRLQNPLRVYALVEALVGVLASGFVMIAALGLPGTLRAAGLLNLWLAVAVWLIAGDARHAALRPGRFVEEKPRTAILLLAVAFFTGLASFVYEISWIRMLSLVMGASTHSFELMLSTFILGLALGGLAVRRRVDMARSPELMLGAVQVAMGLAAAATLPLYGSTFSLMEALMKGLAHSETG